MIGMMGAGKTAVGTALARSLNVAFVDSDHEIEEAANETIAEIFEKYGELFFRKKESQVLARLLEGKACILSTGGGAFLQKDNRDLIARKGLAVWLKADEDLLWSRVRHKTTRPLLRVPDPRQKLSSLLKDREPYYREAGLVVEADENYSVQDMADEVLKALLDHPSGVLRKGV
jgi:shikimate kinase